MRLADVVDKIAGDATEDEAPPSPRAEQRTNHDTTATPRKDAGADLGARSRNVRDMMKIKTRVGDSADDLLDPQQLLQLEALFKSKHNQEMDEKDFVEAFGSVLGGRESDMRGWFMRVDANANGSVDWDEFYNYLLYRHPGTLDNIRAKEYVQGALKVETRTTKHHKHFVSKVLVHPRSGAYWTGAHDGIVKIWSPNLRQVHTINNNLHMGQGQNPSRGVMILDMCQGGKGTIMVSSVNKYINVYNGRYQHVKQFAGRKLVNEKKASGGKILRIEDGVVQREVPTIALLELEEPSTAIHYEQKSDRLLCGLGNGFFHTYNLSRTGGVSQSSSTFNINPDQKIGLHGGGITGIIPVPELGANHYLTSSYDKTIKLVDLEMARAERTLGLGVHRNAICTMDWNPHLKMTVCSGPCRDVFLWNPFVSMPIATLTGHLTNIIGVAFNTVDKQVISMSSDKCVKVWDLRTMKLLQSFVDESDPVMDDKGYTALVYDDRHNRVVAAGTKLNAWPMRRSMANFDTDYKGHTDPLVTVLFTDIFSQIVTVDAGGCVQLWNSETGHREYIFAVFTKGNPMVDGGCRDEGKDGCAVVCAAFDVFERRLFVGDTRGVVSSWNYANGQEIRTIQLHDVSQVSHVCSVARVSPTGEAIGGGMDHRFITASYSDTLYFFSDNVGELAEKVADTYRCPHGSITGLACNKHAREQILLISTEDGRLVLLNMLNGIEMGVFGRGIPYPVTGGGESFAGGIPAQQTVPTFGAALGLHQACESQRGLGGFITAVDAEDDQAVCTCHITMPQQFGAKAGTAAPMGTGTGGSPSLSPRGSPLPQPTSDASGHGPVGVESMTLLLGEFVATVLGSNIVDIYSARAQVLVASIVSEYTDIGGFVIIRSFEDLLIVGDDGGNLHVFLCVSAPCAAHPQAQGVTATQISLFRAHVGSVTSAAVLKGPAHFVMSESMVGRASFATSMRERRDSRASLSSVMEDAVPRCLIVSCGQDLYVRLHTENGTLIGCYGGKLWTVRVPSTWQREPNPQNVSPRARKASHVPNLRETLNAVQERDAKEKSALTVSVGMGCLKSAAGEHGLPASPLGARTSKRATQKHITFEDDVLGKGGVGVASPTSTARVDPVVVPEDTAPLAPDRQQSVVSLNKRRKSKKQRRANNRDELLDKGVPYQPFVKGMPVRLPANTRIPNPITDAQRSRTKETIATVFGQDHDPDHPGSGPATPRACSASRSKSPNVFGETSDGSPGDAYRLAPLRHLPASRRKQSPAKASLVKPVGDSAATVEGGDRGVRYSGGAPDAARRWSTTGQSLFPDITSPGGQVTPLPQVGEGESGDSPVQEGVVEPAGPTPEEILATRICELMQQRKEAGQGPVPSKIQHSVSQQRETNPKEWTRRAVGLLPLHEGQVGFHKVAHPSTKWSTAIRELAKKKSKSAKERQMMDLR